jgi:outer membrane protein
MKYISTILAAMALTWATVVYFVQGREVAGLRKQLDGAKSTSASGGTANFKIAYFDLDTLQARYEMMKDVKNEATDRENAMNQDLASRDRKNQLKIEEWRQRGNTMTQAEAEAANQQLQEMQQEFAKHKQDLEQDLYKFEEGKRNTIRKQIEDYIRDYNKQKNYSYIIAYDGNSFIYNKDTVLNITDDLVNGLNAQYKKSK